MPKSCSACTHIGKGEVRFRRLQPIGSPLRFSATLDRSQAGKVWVQVGPSQKPRFYSWQLPVLVLILDWRGQAVIVVRMVTEGKSEDP